MPTRTPGECQRVAGCWARCEFAELYPADRSRFPEKRLLSASGYLGRRGGSSVRGWPGPGAGRRFFHAGRGALPVGLGFQNWRLPCCPMRASGDPAALAWPMVYWPPNPYSSRSRSKIRFAVWRCFLGTLRSDSSIRVTTVHDGEILKASGARPSPNPNPTPTTPDGPVNKAGEVPDATRDETPIVGDSSSEGHTETTPPPPSPTTDSNE